MIYDFFKIGGDNEAILNFRDFIESSTEERQRSSTKWDEALSEDTVRPTDNILKSLYKMQVEKVGRVEMCVASQRSRDGDKFYDWCRLKNIKDSLF